MTRFTTRTIVAALCAAALGVAGCGGDDSSAGANGDNATGLTAAEWRTQADAICADSKKQLEAVGEPNPADLTPFLEKGLAISTERATKFAALVPPTELAETQSKAVGLLNDSNKLIQSAVDRIKAGTPAPEAIGAVDAAMTKNGADLDALAKEAGLTTCGAD